MINARSNAHRGFTLVEVLIATAITLILMGVVVTMFGMVGEAVSDTRAAIQMVDQLRAAQHTLKSDLAGVTARMLPPLKPEEALGYLEYVEGPVVEPYLGSGIGPLMSANLVALNINEAVGGNPAPDSTAGDFDDVLMFTTRSQDQPFVGRYNGVPTQSQVAEVAWFMRGNTLYRRVLLVRPGLAIEQTTLANAGYYAKYDLSARQEGGQFDRSPSPGPVRIVPNSLGDLTKRENRFGHQPYVYPHDIRFWGVASKDFSNPSSFFVGALGLPTLRECSAIDAAQTPSGLWPFPQIEPPPGTTWPGMPGGATTQQSNVYGDAYSQLIVPSGVPLPLGSNPLSLEPIITPTPNGVSDLWLNPNPWTEFLDTSAPPPMLPTPTSSLQPYGVAGTRLAEDVMLNNVLSFDVKAWDPMAPVIRDDSTGTVYLPGDPEYARVYNAGTWSLISHGAYVDLNYLNDSATPTVSSFSGRGNIRSGLQMSYDTWSTHYERDGFNQGDYLGATLVDEGTDGLDNDGLGGADDAGELEAPAPYPVPLRGIQVKIRVFEPDSRQIRELTVVHKFLPE